jgi:hypothetical protein
LLCCACTASCSESGGPVETPAVSLELPPALRLPYRKHAFPGPWWRDHAVRDDFESDVRTCRAESTAARGTTPDGDENDVAYRGFIDRMNRHAWNRGYPPPPETQDDT